jgi:hypothetical protein
MHADVFGWRVFISTPVAHEYVFSSTHPTIARRVIGEELVNLDLVYTTPLLAYRTTVMHPYNTRHKCIDRMATVV